MYDYTTAIQIESAGQYLNYYFYALEHVSHGSAQRTHVLFFNKSLEISFEKCPEKNVNI